MLRDLFEKLDNMSATKCSTLHSSSFLLLAIANLVPIIGTWRVKDLYLPLKLSNASLEWQINKSITKTHNFTNCAYLFHSPFPFLFKSSVLTPYICSFFYSFFFFLINFHMILGQFGQYDLFKNLNLNK